jgi:hypothetical protein
MANKKGDYRGKTNLPRGVRNNNPLMIRTTRGNGNKFKFKVLYEENSDFIDIAGKSYTVRQYEQFRHIDWGLRAALVLMITFNKKHGLNTIDKLLTMWHTSGVDLEVFIKYVCKKSRIDRNYEFDHRDKDRWWRIMKGMASYYGNGRYVTPVYFAEAWEWL